MIPPTPRGWIETTATVTFCRYQSRALSALAFGFRVGEKFRIGFSYRVHGRLYDGEFDSPFAIPQNERIALSYNPQAPEQNNRTSGTAGARSPGTSLLPAGLAAAVILALAWLTFLHGCSFR